VVEITGIVQDRNDKTAKAAIVKEEETGVKDFFVTAVELEITEIKVLAESEIPFELNEELKLDTYLDNMPYTLRSEKVKAIFKVQSEIVKAYREILSSEDFVEIQVPKIVGDDAEGGADIFEIDYFGGKASLASSPQLYKQIMVGVFERVFAVGNVYRAEKHSTSRHINEYTSLDYEFGFIDSASDIMTMHEKVLRYISQKVSENCKKELAIFGMEAPRVPEGEFPRLSLKEAQVVLEEKMGVKDAIGEPDLEPEHERLLCDYAKKELNSDFIFISGYPVSKRPFYTYESDDEKGVTDSFDALFRGVEITTGGQRRHTLKSMIEGIENKGLDASKFDFYLQAFKTGMPKHGGIGMGLERLTQKFLGLDNVKRATLFPREINRIDKLIKE
jgi:nondiscriminating aspartyl-tRNA synthetase